MLNKISNSLLAPSGLELSHLNQVLDHFSGRDIDYADLYLQLSQDESWSLEDSIIKEGDFISTEVLACVLCQAKKQALRMPIKSHSNS